MKNMAIVGSKKYFFNFKVKMLEKILQIFPIKPCLAKKFAV